MAELVLQKGAAFDQPADQTQQPKRILFDVDERELVQHIRAKQRLVQVENDRARTGFGLGSFRVFGRCLHRLASSGNAENKTTNLHSNLFVITVSVLSLPSRTNLKQRSHELLYYRELSCFLTAAA